MIKGNLLSIFAIVALLSCSNNQEGELSPDARFREAMVDSAKELTEDDIYNGLVSLEYGDSPLATWKIEGEDTLILVSTLQESDWYYSSLNVGESDVTSSSPNHTLWVTIPGELNNTLCSEPLQRDSISLNNRLLELIGLRPNDTNSTINLIWINKNHLLRPSYVTSTTTTHGAIDYSSAQPVEDWYKEWFESNIDYSYESPSNGLNYPFTRLGYTYDWGEGKSKFGLSEFITAPSSPFTLESKMGCWEYYNTIYPKNHE